MLERAGSAAACGSGPRQRGGSATYNHVIVAGICGDVRRLTVVSCGKATASLASGRTIFLELESVDESTRAGGSTKNADGV